MDNITIVLIIAFALLEATAIYIEIKKGVFIDVAYELAKAVLFCLILFCLIR